MKSIFTLLFCGFVLIAGKTHAQNYQPITNTGFSFFLEPGNDLHFARIDSVKVLNGDSICFLNRIWNTQDFDCINPYGYNTFGGKMIKKTDGGYQFIITDRDDSVLLYPALPLNSSWHFYTDSNYYIEARITSISLDSVITTIDSIKTISLTKKDLNGVVINSPFNSAKIKISKNYGFTETITFNELPDSYYNFTMIGNSDPAIGKNIITNREMYDYEIGDEFHYDYAYSTPPNGSGTFRKKINKVTEKNYNPGNDSVFYTIQITESTETVNWTTHERHDTIINYISRPKIYLKNKWPLPFQPTGGSSHIWYFGSGGRRVIAQSGDSYYRESDSCWIAIITLSHSSFPSSYIEGIGLYQSGYDHPPGQDHENLVYYKKGNEVWGTPVVITSVPQTREKYISTYPNPVNEDQFYISLTPEMKEVRIYDLLGRKVYSQTTRLQAEIISVDTSELPAGIYTVQATHINNAISTQKLVVE